MNISSEVMGPSSLKELLAADGVEVRCIAVHQQKIFLRNDNNQLQTIFPLSEIQSNKKLTITHYEYLGQVDGFHCVVAVVAGSDVSALFTHLRALINELSAEEFSLLGLAVQLSHWGLQHKFCGYCGNECCQHETERAKVCRQCKNSFYPKISPCIIVLITNNENILLARSPHFPEGYFSVLAGFVEAGETVEQAVHREVKEEVAITVKNVQYIASQPWPFPHSLMLGFKAEYADGEIHVDGEEIEQAYWANEKQLPKIPPPGTLSRYLMDLHFNKHT